MTDEAPQEKPNILKKKHAPAVTGVTAGSVGLAGAAAGTTTDPFTPALYWACSTFLDIPEVCGLAPMLGALLFGLLTGGLVSKARK